MEWLVITIDEVDAKIEEVFIQIKGVEGVNFFFVHRATVACDERVSHFDERDALADDLGNDEDIDNHGEDATHQGRVSAVASVV